METITKNILMVGYSHRLNSRFIQKQIQGLGDTCTVIAISRIFSDDAYREETETETDHDNVPCFVHILTEGDTSVDEGEARAGDLIFTFDYSSVGFLKQGNRIIFNNETFQIYDVRPFKTIHNAVRTIDCYTKKYSDGTENEETLSENLKTSDEEDNDYTSGGM